MRWRLAGFRRSIEHHLAVSLSLSLSLSFSLSNSLCLSVCLRLCVLFFCYDWAAGWMSHVFGVLQLTTLSSMHTADAQRMTRALVVTSLDWTRLDCPVCPATDHWPTRASTSRNHRGGGRHCLLFCFLFVFFLPLLALFFFPFSSLLSPRWIRLQSYVSGGTAAALTLNRTRRCKNSPILRLPKNSSNQTPAWALSLHSFGQEGRGEVATVNWSPVVVTRL